MSSSDRVQTNLLEQARRKSTHRATLTVTVIAAFAMVGCGDDSSMTGGAGEGGTSGAGGVGTGGAAGVGGIGGSCTAALSDGVLTNVDGVEFFSGRSSSVEIITAKFFTLERESGTTVFAYGEIQNTGSSLQCSLFMDLALDGLGILAISEAPAYQNPFSGSSAWCLAPGEIGAFQAIENSVPSDLVQNLAEVDYDFDVLTFGDETPHHATPTIVSSEIEFTAEDEPFVSGVARTTPTDIFNLKMTFYLRNSCGLLVGTVNAFPGALPTDGEFDFQTAPAITMQGTDVQDYLLFQSFATN